MSYDLVSLSEDRALKIWDTDKRAFLENLYGHGGNPVWLERLGNKNMISVGYDKQPIIWKIEEEKILKFSKLPFSIDCVTQLNPFTFATGSENGDLHLWAVNKKKPIYSLRGCFPCGWLSSLVCFPNSDLLISGGNDNLLRFHKLVYKGVKKCSIEETFQVECTGVINCLQLNKNGQMMAVVQSSENRLGRWTPMKKQRNAVKIYKLF
jgi:ribosomal RNA-processing protein 9